MENLKQQFSLSKPQEESTTLQPQNENTRSGKQKKKKNKDSSSRNNNNRKINNSNTYNCRSSSNNSKYQLQGTTAKENTDPARNENRSTTVPGEHEGKAYKHITAKTKSRQITIAGDSIIKGLKGWMMAKDNRVKVHSFSGATASEMEYFIKPLLERKPSHFIIHCRTNDLAQGDSCNEIIQRITNLTRNIVNNGMTCSVSTLTKRTDGLNPLVIQVNNLLEKAYKSEAHIDIINNEAINEYYLMVVGCISIKKVKLVRQDCMKGGHGGQFFTWEYFWVNF